MTARWGDLGIEKIKELGFDEWRRRTDVVARRQRYEDIVRLLHTDWKSPTCLWRLVGSRARNALYDAGFVSEADVESLRTMSIEELRRIPNLGKIGLAEVVAFLRGEK